MSVFLLANDCWLTRHILYHIRCSLVGQHEWNGAIESHLVVQLVLKHIQIIQTIGVTLTGGEMEGESVRVTE